MSNSNRNYLKEDKKATNVMGSLVKEATSIPFNVANGMREPLEGNSYGTDSEPCLMRLVFQPTLGISTSVDSPAYRAAREAWSVININNGRIPPYDPSDLQLMFYASGHAVIAITWAKRIYNLCLTYENENRAIPEMFFEAEGLDYEEFRAKLSDYRARLDLLIRQFNAVLRVPEGMDFMARAQRLLSKAYTDEETKKTQMYYFTPACFYAWDEGSIDPETSEAIPTRLIPIPLRYIVNSTPGVDWYSKPQFETSSAVTAVWTDRSSLMGPDQVMDILESIVNPLILSQDVAIMTADIINAGLAVHTIDYINPDDTFEVSKDDGMISIIENMRIVPQARRIVSQSSTAANGADAGVFFPVITINNDINRGNAEFTYTSGSLYGVANSYFKTLGAFRTKEMSQYCNGKLVNMHTDDPTPEEQYTITRWIPHVRQNSVYKTCVDVVSCSTELIVDAVIYWARYSNVDPAIPSVRRIVWAHIPAMLMNVQNPQVEGEYIGFSQMDMRVLSYVTSFHRHPELMHLNYDYLESTMPGLGKPVTVSRYWELDKYAMFQDNILDRCHTLNNVLAFNTSVNKSGK